MRKALVGGFTDWVADVVCLADYLGLPKFSILGNSGGGGYVAVCAASIPERLLSAVIVSGGWRMDSRKAGQLLKGTYKMNWFVAKYAPFLLTPMLKMIGEAGDKPSQNPGPMEKTMAPPDVKAVGQGDRLQWLMKSLAEAVRLGAKGAAWDMRMYFRQWDFELEEITMPLNLFHGDLDRNFPIALVREMVAAIPSAHLTVYPGEAHLSTLVNHFEEIANCLLLDASRTEPLNSPPGGEEPLV
ncbi:MAG: alpha/beta hydrolase [Chlorobia bacterium]|nr:alpha/beta hydrolase [Fimbriimonadaceae bacterium]